MDEDAILTNALNLLRNQFGGQVRGPMGSTQAQMRQALMQGLGVDDLAADRVVKKLAQTGKLRYAGTRDEPQEPGNTTLGPVGTVVGSTTSQGVGPIIAPLAAAAPLGAMNNPSGMAGSGPAIGAAALASDAAADQPSDAGQQIGPADVNRRDAENREGASMGQLGDTSVEGSGSGPRTVGQEQELDEDNTEGAWIIG